MKLKESTRHKIDRLILAAIFLGWSLGTAGYYQLFKETAEAQSVTLKIGLFVAAVFAAPYTLITFVLVIVLPLSHLIKALRKNSF